MKLNITLLAALCILGVLRTVAIGQQPTSPAPNPYGASPMIMYAQLKGDRGIRFSTHSAVWKYARHTDGYIGTPGSKVTEWTTSLSRIQASTASGSPITDETLRTKLADKTLVVVSLNDSEVPPEFLKIFNRDALVLKFKDIREIRRLLRMTGAEFEPGTETEGVTKR